MTIGTMVLVIVGSLILALIAWLVTGNLLIGLLFPILLIAFFFMWRSLKQDTQSQPKMSDNEEKGEISPEAVSDLPNTEEADSTPPISTSYPPTQQQ